MYKIILFSFITLLVACNQTPTESFSTEGAWVREAPPNAGAMAGYVTIKNNTDQDRILSFAKSNQFNAVEIHRTIVENGVAKMRRQEDLPILAGGSLILEPGSYHLMLMTPKSAFKANDEITVTVGLKLDDNIQEVDIVMPVKKPNS
ncbi:MAG: copper chaperone PCu(A)C [Gammaproteobacteria bacterium]|nr:MAG: copper chaperone PCu(A)C [Gammaproteobacteria bacterium]